MIRSVRIGVATLLVLSVTVLVAGCGGSQDRFSGTADVPDGFEAVEGPGASFAQPGGWLKEQRPVGRDGGEIVTVRAPQKVGSATPTITLTRTGDLNGSFDGSLDLRRDFAEKAGEDRSKTDQEEIAVPGSEKAILFSGQASYGGRRYDSYDLAVLLEDGSAVFFGVEVPEGGDADGILDSFRLTDT